MSYLHVLGRSLYNSKKFQDTQIPWHSSQLALAPPDSVGYSLSLDVSIARPKKINNPFQTIYSEILRRTRHRVTVVMILCYAFNCASVGVKPLQHRVHVGVVQEEMIPQHETCLTVDTINRCVNPESQLEFILEGISCVVPKNDGQVRVNAGFSKYVLVSCFKSRDVEDVDDLGYKRRVKDIIEPGNQRRSSC